MSTPRPVYKSVWAGITKYHRLGGWNKRNLFLTVFKDRSPRSGCHILVRTLFLASDGHLLTVLTWQKEKVRARANSSYKGTNPIMKDPPSWPQSTLFPKTSSPNTSTLRGDISVYTLLGLHNQSTGTRDRSLPFLTSGQLHQIAEPVWILLGRKWGIFVDWIAMASATRRRLSKWSIGSLRSLRLKGA